MKTVNATWELRNLGKRTIELTLEKADFLHEPKQIYEDINAKEKEYHSEYTVVKVKSGKPQIGWELQKQGFWHIETQVNLKAAYEDVVSAVKKVEGLFDDISLQVVETSAEVCHIQAEIRRGMFTTDRIALDPYFGVEIANRRYAYWVEDEVKKGSILSYAISKGDKIGFALGRNGHGLLGGIFTQYQKRNMGIESEIAGWREIIREETDFFYTAVSSNNLRVLRLHEAFGYRVKSLFDVFVRHDPLI